MIRSFNMSCSYIYVLIIHFVSWRTYSPRPFYIDVCFSVIYSMESVLFFYRRFDICSAITFDKHPVPDFGYVLFRCLLFFARPPTQQISFLCVQSYDTWICISLYCTPSNVVNDDGHLNIHLYLFYWEMAISLKNVSSNYDKFVHKFCLDVE